MSEARIVTQIAQLTFWSVMLGVAIGTLVFFSQGYSLPIFTWDDGDTEGAVILSAQGIAIESRSTTAQPLPTGYVERTDPNGNEVEVTSYRFYREPALRRDCVELVTYLRGEAVRSTAECSFY